MKKAKTIGSFGAIFGVAAVFIWFARRRRFCYRKPGDTVLCSVWLDSTNYCDLSHGIVDSYSKRSDCNVQ